jgi:hypothetical protein
MSEPRRRIERLEKQGFQPRGGEAGYREILKQRIDRIGQRISGELTNDECLDVVSALKERIRGYSAKEWSGI